MSAQYNVRNYATITGAYWAFTLTDGAIRMLVVLYFHQLGYTPLAIASLFLFYEFFGIITNLVGGWLGARFGLNITLHTGMALQVFALLMLTVPAEYLSIVYVMVAQALSGIAKDLNKMSAKASVKRFVPQNTSNTLFKWVALLTGSKNTLKGVGYFLGGLLLTLYSFQTALFLLAGGLFAVLLLTWFTLPHDLGKTKSKAKFSQLFAHEQVINWLAAARFFLFGARDVWFVVALPVYLNTALNWSYEQIGSFFALWIIGYGIIQVLTPKLLNYRKQYHTAPNGKTAQHLATILFFAPAIMAITLYLNLDANTIIIVGLSLFAILFALNSAVHSYLIIEWSDHDKVAMNVGFYYMANAGGRLTGTLLSGLLFQYYGLIACLIAASLFIASAALLSKKLSL